MRQEDFWHIKCRDIAMYAKFGNKKGIMWYKVVVGQYGKCRIIEDWKE